MSSEGEVPGFGWGLARDLLLAPLGVWRSHRRRARFEAMCARATTRGLSADAEGLRLPDGRQLPWARVQRSAWYAQTDVRPFAQADEGWMLALRLDGAELWVGPIRVSTDKASVSAVNSLLERGLLPSEPEDLGASSSRVEHLLLALWLVLVAPLVWLILR